MLFFFQDQYIFIHDAVLESVTCGDTEIKAADLRRKLVKLKTRDQSGLTALDLQFAVSDIFFVRKQQGKGKVNQDSSCFFKEKIAAVCGIRTHDIPLSRQVYFTNCATRAIQLYSVTQHSQLPFLLHINTDTGSSEWKCRRCTVCCCPKQPHKEQIH